MTLEDVPPQVLVGLIALVAIVLARLRPRRARTGRLIVGPCVIMTIGAALLASAIATTTTWAVLPTVTVAVLDLVLSVGLGLARGATVEIRPGPASQVQIRYTSATVALWAVSIVLRFGLAGLGASIGAAAAVSEGSILLALGLSLLAQNAIVIAAVQRQSRRPALTPRA